MKMTRRPGRALVSCLALLVAGLALGACGDSQESVLEDRMDLMKEMTGVLKGIKTPDDAKAAQSKLDSLAKDFQALAERAKDIEDPTPEQAKAMAEKMQSEWMPVMKDFQAEIMRIASNQELREALGDAFEKAQSASK